jgi:uncharacterized coiled-coil DUF342 family protein
VAGWITLLKNVPWAEVVNRAPAIADGARKLWQTLRKKPAGEAADNPPAAENDATDIAAQLHALKREVADLRQQMIATSELINSLADQDAQLIQRIEALRKRQRWLAAGLVALALGAAALLLFLTGR